MRVKKNPYSIVYRVICGPIGLILTVLLSIIVLMARSIIFLAYFIGELLIIFAYALYINGGLLLRFLNFMNYAVIVEHFGHDRLSLFG